MAPAGSFAERTGRNVNDTANQIVGLKRLAAMGGQPISQAGPLGQGPGSGALTSCEFIKQWQTSAVTSAQLYAPTVLKTVLYPLQRGSKEGNK